MLLLDRELLNNLEEEVHANNELQMEGLKLYASLWLHANKNKELN